MRRRSLKAVFLLAAFLAATAAGLFALLRYEPPEYRAAGVESDWERRRQVSEMVQKFTLITENVQARSRWSQTLTDEQLNCYFIEDPNCSFLPDGVSCPRVRFRPDRVTLAFRYGQGFASSVISIDADVWLPAGETNVLALRLKSLKAGLLPWSTQFLLDGITDGARHVNYEVAWHRDGGDPVAVFRPRDDVRPSVVLQKLELRQGQLLIEGTTDGPAPFRAPLGPLALVP